jgi:hypothetical protein
LGDPGAGNRIILKRITKKDDERAWSGFNWLRIGTFLNMVLKNSDKFFRNY